MPAICTRARPQLHTWDRDRARLSHAERAPRGERRAAPEGGVGAAGVRALPRGGADSLLSGAGGTFWIGP